MYLPRKAVDLGSQILMQHLPEDIEGAGADLGAGYGYLSYSMLFKCRGITTIHLYEAEYLALKAAEHNIEQAFNRAKKRKTNHALDDLSISYNWHDVTQGIPHSNLDWIVMNPPFHFGLAENVDIGRMFIETAYQALRKGGQLFMVANRHLPYEGKIKQLFKTMDKIAEEKGFKVYGLRK